jgi:hypothetical protein
MRPTDAATGAALDFFIAQQNADGSWNGEDTDNRSGWYMAERITPLMGIRWEDGLDKPLDVRRRELNVEPVREGQNSFSFS